jgi:hypothetical protein
VTSLLKVSLCVGLASVALLCAVAQPARAASTGTPCWKVLLNDWYDGRIDGSYQRHCYTDALKHLPADVSTYSSAHDDIQRALQAAIAKQRAAGQTVGPKTVIKPPSGRKKSGGSSKTDTTQTDTTQTGRKQETGIAGKLNPASPSSVPVPLLILGGLALVLVAAGGAGLVVKRIQARRQSP